MSEHSPLPWHNDDGFIKDASGKIVDMRAVNRLLIIPAVNSHDALLAAAQRTALVMKDRMHFGNATTNIFKICFEDLQAAITTVEEEAP